MTATEILVFLKRNRNPRNLEGMARYGITIDNAFGVPLAVLRDIAKQHRRQHQLAIELWGSGVHDARLLALFIDDPAAVTADQMDAWAGDFNSWDLCDGACIHLFRKTPHAHTKARTWTKRKEEFVRRAGFALIATLGVHDKRCADHVFLEYLKTIEEAATDERNFVKKAVNWALRQIGKRNILLNSAAIATAERLLSLESRSARWIARDALRELRNPKILSRIAQ